MENLTYNQRLKNAGIVTDRTNPKEICLVYGEKQVKRPDNPNNIECYVLKHFGLVI